MLTDSVIVIIENSKGQKLFDRIIYTPAEQRDQVHRRMALLNSFGYKAKMVDIPLVGFDVNAQWDIFLAYAMAYGVPYDLALVGRECLRRGHEHQWTSELNAQYHLHDDLHETIQFALQEPEKAREVWSSLIRGKGEKS